MINFDGVLGYKVGWLQLRILLKQNTALLSTVRVCVRVCVTGVASHISHICKGLDATLIIRGLIKPYIF